MQHKILRLGFLWCWALLLCCCGCNNSTPTAEPECPHGKPRPLFSKDMNGVTRYSFECTGNNSVERLSLPELAFDLELLESGCEQKTQEIRLTVLPYQGQMEELPTPSACAQFFGEIMLNISSIAPQNPNLRSLQEWGIAIAQLHPKIQYNTPLPIEGQPFTVQLDKMEQPGSILLTVIIRMTA